MNEIEERIKQIGDIFIANKKKRKIISIADKYLEIELTKCPCCNNEYDVKIVQGVAQDQPDVFWIECQYCKAWSVSRMPKQEFLEAAYTIAYKLHDKDEAFYNYQRLAMHIVKKTNLLVELKSINGNYRILDYGSGNGDLLVALNQILNPNQNITYLGVDIINENKILSSNEAVALLCALPDRDKKFELIIASAVIEHIPDANSILLNLYTRMADNGLMYIRTPWHGPLKKVYKKMDLGFPGHVHDMGQLFWENIWGEIGCKIDIVYSAPSINQTEYRYNFFRTLIVDILKLPAFIHNKFRKKGKEIIWPYVGGWEIVVRKLPDL